MSMEIAVFIDSNGKTMSLNQSGIAHVYLKDKEEWKIIKEIVYEINDLMSSNTIRSNIKNMANSLGACRVIVASEVKGVSYTILDSMGFNIWMIEGVPEDFLDEVANSEEEDKLNKDKVEVIPSPIKNGNNNYFFDLKTEMQNNNKFSSKQMLVPFLKNTKFNELEIICGHLPPWFEESFKMLNYSSTVETIDKNTLKVKVRPKYLD